jgi:hypothetical protein
MSWGTLEYHILVEMLVRPGCRLVGKTIAEAGLRHLPGLFLIEIDREGKALGPVGPDVLIQTLDLDQAKISLTTFPATSVRRKSRPA